MPANNRKPPAKMMEEAMRCYELQNMGLSTYQIADEMGFSQKTVRNRIDLHILNRKHPKADEMRMRQVDRLHMYLRSLRKTIESGDPKAIANAVRVEERIAKLLGLDSATAFKVEVENVDVNTEFNKMLDKLIGQEGRTEREGNRPRPPASHRKKALPSVAITYDPSQPAPHNPETEFANADTFAAHEVHKEAVTIAEDLEEFEPAPRPVNKRRRGQPIPNPAAQFLRDSDDD